MKFIAQSSSGQEDHCLLSIEPKAEFWRKEGNCWSVVSTSQSQAMIRKNYGKLVTLKDSIQNLKGSVRELTHKGLKMHSSFWIISKRHCRKTIPHVVVSWWMKRILLRFSIFQTGHMRNLYEKFPDILLVDGTYIILLMWLATLLPWKT